MQDIRTPAQQNIMTSSRLLFIAGQFPPPVTGFSYITQEMARLAGTSFKTKIIDLSPHRKRGGVTYHLHRLCLTLKGAFILLLASKHKSPIFYIACESKLGLFYTIFLSGAARILGYKTYIHHHNFNYIDSTSSLIKILLTSSGPHAKHIFLCEKMAALFNKRYKKSVHYEVLSNSAFVAPPLIPQLKVPNAGEPIVVGLLSNLNNAKGLDIFLTLLKQTSLDMLNVSGILAGPPDSSSEKKAIDEAKSILGDKLDYLGPVYAQDKEAFFRSIDVFVFPTRYANEAQPTVIYEAMARGIPVLSYDRGCILSQVGACGSVQGREEDFVSFAISWLKHYSSDAQALTQLKYDTQKFFLYEHQNSLKQATQIFGTT